MCLKHLVDRYNIFYAFKPSRIDKNIHNTAITFVLWSVIMLQIVITFFTGLRSGNLVIRFDYFLHRPMYTERSVLFQS